MTDLMIAYSEKCQAMGLPVHDGDGPHQESRVDPEAGWEVPHAVLRNPLLGTSLDAEIPVDPRPWLERAYGDKPEGTDDAAAIQAAINGEAD